MSIKITNASSSVIQNSSSISDTQAAEKTGQTIESDVVETGQPVDPVMQIAQDVAAGQISSDQAVEKLIAHTMGEEMIASAPSELREELESILQTMMETDPYLKSLAGGLNVSANTEG